MISKFYAGSLDSKYKELGILKPIQGRCSGDTEGRVLMSIGLLMRKDTPYFLVIDNDVVGDHKSLKEREIVFRLIQMKVEELNLKFFEFEAKTLIVKYKPWMD